MTGMVALHIVLSLANQSPGRFYTLPVNEINSVPFLEGDILQLVFTIKSNASQKTASGLNAVTVSQRVLVNVKIS